MSSTLEKDEYSSDIVWRIGASINIILYRILMDFSTLITTKVGDKLVS